MSFDTYETSAESGQPVELYDFSLGSTRYRYTSDPIDVVYLTNTYAAIPISRGRLSVSKEEQNGDRIEITMPASDVFPQQYVSSVPGKKATLTLTRYHRNDPAQEGVIVFKGTVATIRFVDEAVTAKLTVIPVTAAESRPIPRMCYSNLCNHMLYDVLCGIGETAAAWQKTFNCTSASANTITVPGAGACGADFFEGGFVNCDGDYRLVVDQSGDNLVLFTPFSLSPVGKSVKCNAGCKHRVEDCRDKFSNIANYGGFPFVPLKNPFESGIE
jgi:uncharacterized phage protein (TIGR02218 family)